MVRRAIRFAVNAGLVAACVVLFAMMALIVAEVILRSAFGISLQVVDEYSGYMVVAIFFFGVAYCLQANALLRVELLFRLLRARAQGALTILFNFMALAFTLTVTYQLATFAFGSWLQGVFAPTTVMTPLYVPQLVMPLGMSLLCIVLVAELVFGIRDFSRRGDRDSRKAGPPQ